MCSYMRGYLMAEKCLHFEYELLSKSILCVWLRNDYVLVTGWRRVCAIKTLNYIMIGIAKLHSIIFR